MVHSSNRLRPREFLTADFPTDHPASPAIFTVPLAWLYGRASGSYHRWHDRHEPFHASVPVISVGNITVGGTGKTPFVVALTKLIAGMNSEFARHGAMAVLSRGYGRSSRELVVVESSMDYHMTGDEPLLIKKAIPFVNVVVHPDRIRSARFAVEQLGARLLILDDGFQHRRLVRDLDLVLMDGQSPAGNGYLLPAGPLREDIRNLNRASVLIGVGENASNVDKLGRTIKKSVLFAIPKTILPPELSTNLSTPSVLVTSIARPGRIHNALINIGLNIRTEIAFRDHHRFTREDYSYIIHQSKAAGAERIIITAKDQIRMTDWNDGFPLKVIDVEMDLLQQEIYRLLLEPVLNKAVK